MTPPNAPGPKRKLPIGIQTFATLRQEGYYYVDKTPFALRLIAEGQSYFLSRPRRFGKSLFLDTLKELFEGNQALFEGLHAHDRWDWSTPHPVLRLSLGGGVVRDRAELDARLREWLAEGCARHGLTLAAGTLAGGFAELLRLLHERTGRRVVVLVDEYDKPILDHLTDPAVARAMRDALRDFYAVIKDADAHVRFAFLTGVSKFSKVSLFSGLNNLQDLTLSAPYSALCGYTEADLDAVFAPELAGLDRDEIRRWYNGYNWTGEAVYNPFDLLLLFQNRLFKPYWFETGTPTFLIDLLAQRQLFTPDLARKHSTEALLGAFDVDHLTPEALLFQTGYLTIRETREPMLGHWVFTLGYPNREVEASLNAALLTAYGPEAHPALEARLRTIELLRTGDAAGLGEVFTALFASIPHDWYRKSPLAQYEGHYASVVYSHLAALGLDTRVENATNHGRIDLALRFGDRVFLFAFKVVADAPEGGAIAQLEARGYAEKYRAPGVAVVLVGMEFSRERRNLVAFDVRPA
jgi:hypothetical protein